MPLHAPPAPSVLAALPRFRLAGLVLHRVYRHDRRSPWWFASAPTDPDDGGRFDLPAPRGTCYLGTTVAAAVLEALQDLGGGLLPEAELRARRAARVAVPHGAPPAAHLTARTSRARGVTAALWAGDDRALTQQWAAALARGGWLALRCGLQHDPTGHLRGVALFDDAGEHAPYDDEQGWGWTEALLVDDPAVHRVLAAHGITVTADPSLPVVPLEDSGLLS